MIGHDVMKTLLLGSLLLGACSSADLCPPEGCLRVSEPDPSSTDPDPSQQTAYAKALASDCRGLCTWLDDCEITLYTSPDLSCQQACESQTRFDHYFDCEPSYRRFLACAPLLTTCELAPCWHFLDAYTSCLESPYPASANSCVLANNGVCNEPDDCVPGSDTNDCAGDSP